jgi:hypothetical protein
MSKGLLWTFTSFLFSFNIIVLRSPGRAETSKQVIPFPISQGRWASLPATWGIPLDTASSSAFRFSVGLILLLNVSIKSTPPNSSSDRVCFQKGWAKIIIPSCLRTSSATSRNLLVVISFSRNKQTTSPHSVFISLPTITTRGEWLISFVSNPPRMVL